MSPSLQIVQDVLEEMGYSPAIASLVCGTGKQADWASKVTSCKSLIGHLLSCAQVGRWAM
jgi:nitrogen regulatory protein PII